MQAIPKMLLALALITLVWPCSAHAKTFDAASNQADADLTASLNELSEVRDAIATEKIPLISDVSSLEDDVRQKSDELNRLRHLRDNSDLGLNRLREQVEAIQSQNEYTGSLLDEFVRSFETRVDYSETNSTQQPPKKHASHWTTQTCRTASVLKNKSMSLVSP